MTDAFSREFLKFEVKETDEGKGYWLDQPWVDAAQRAALLKAQVLAVPHVSYGSEGPVFPVGSEAFLARFREALGADGSLGIAIRSADYRELALHSKAWRLPTLFVSSIAVPLVINILAARMDALLPGHATGDTAEITLIVEGPNHKTLKVHFKGDPKDLGDFLKRAVPRFVDELDTAPASPHQAHPRTRLPASKS
ncbi:hypothetical protein ACQR0V_23580 [Bradyrhizobium sp. HKCCYLS2058]|uniref:hypothetical protein n=1 Tax=unclassified Bradyrhizobium TaxID=2631580 RepID=UPI003EBB4639